MDSPIINSISLCSGIGMLDLGVELGLEHLGIRGKVLGYFEREVYAAQILLGRMEDSALDSAPIWCGDFEDVDWKTFRGLVDLVTAGFPCQPWSAAGKQAGTDDERWLWPAIVRLVSEVEPSLIFLENVPGLVSGGGFERVLSDLAALGFDAEWCSIAAAEVGASHERERIFVLAFDPSRGRGILRQSSGCGGLVGGVALWQSPQTSDMNGIREPDGKRSLGLNTQTAIWPTPAARDHKGENSEQHALVTGGAGNTWIS